MKNIRKATAMHGWKCFRGAVGMIKAQERENRVSKRVYNSYHETKPKVLQKKS